MFELEILQANEPGELKAKFAQWIIDHDGYTIMQIQFSQAVVNFGPEERRLAHDSGINYYLVFLYAKKSKFLQP